MAGHAQLKFVMTECSKTQIRVTGLNCYLSMKNTHNLHTWLQWGLWKKYCYRLFGWLGTLWGRWRYTLYCHLLFAIPDQTTKGEHKRYDKNHDFYNSNLWHEPRHDKTNKMSVRPAKTQISLGMRPVWSESSLCAHWVAKDPTFLHADSEDSDQTERMLGAHSFCWFCHVAAHIGMKHIDRRPRIRTKRNEPRHVMSWLKWLQC